MSNEDISKDISKDNNKDIRKDNNKEISKDAEKITINFVSVSEGSEGTVSFRSNRQNLGEVLCKLFPKGIQKKQKSGLWKGIVNAGYYVMGMETSISNYELTFKLNSSISTSLLDRYCNIIIGSSDCPKRLTYWEWAQVLLLAKSQENINLVLESSDRDFKTDDVCLSIIVSLILGLPLTKTIPSGENVTDDFLDVLTYLIGSAEMRDPRDQRDLREQREQRELAMRLWDKYSQNRLLVFSDESVRNVRELMPNITGNIKDDEIMFDKHVMSYQTGLAFPINKNVIDYYFDNLYHRAGLVSSFLTAVLSEPSIVLAGGSVVDIVRATMGKSRANASTDLDLFILGPMNDDKRLVLRRLLNRISLFFNEQHDLYFGFSGGVITLWFTQYLRHFSIQIILANESTALELLNRFDLSCCKALWNGQNIMCTRDFIDAVAFDVARAEHSTLRRLLKYNMKGWKVITHQNSDTHLLQERYNNMSNEELSEIRDKLLYDSCYYLLSGYSTEGIEKANIHELQRKFPNLTKDGVLCASRVPAFQWNNYNAASDCSDFPNVPGILALFPRIDKIENMIITNSYFRDDTKEMKRENKRVIKIQGLDGSLTWFKTINNLFQPRLDNLPIVFRFELNNRKLGDKLTTPDLSLTPIYLKASSPNFLHELAPELRISFDSVSRKAFLESVKKLYYDFINYILNDKHSQRSLITFAAEKKQTWNRINVDYEAISLQDFSNSLETSWPKKLLKDGILWINSRKIAQSNIFYRGPGLKTEHLGHIGSQGDYNLDLLKQLKLLDMSKHKVILELAICFSPSYTITPCTSVKNITIICTE